MAKSDSHSQKCPKSSTSRLKKRKHPQAKRKNRARNLFSFNFGRSKKREIEKFYQKQFDLMENFEQDSKQIQDYQQKRQLQQSLNSLNKISDDTDVQQETAKKPITDSNNLTTPDTSLLETAVLMDDGESESDADKLLPQNFSTTDKEKEDPEIVRVGSLENSSKQTLPSLATIPNGRNSNSLARTARRLAFFTLMVNLSLTVAKCVASYLSGSLSIISSLVDSFVDITSGLVIWLTGRAIRKHDPYLYPVGRTRLEPVALVIVSVIMAVASVQMIVQSVESIIQNRIHPIVDWPTISIMVSTVFVKFCLFIICNKYRNDPSTRVLAQDHRNDCLSNSIALLCAFCAEKFWLYLDPIGAILVALYIAITWYRTGREHLIMLSGRSAQPEFINRIIKVCIDHDPRILFIDTVYVYHFGTRFLVEVHIVMDENMPLKVAHDISESLQNSIEALPDVERAFLHVDYEYEHKPIDEHKIP